MKKNIRFILNPISGGRAKVNIPAQIEALINKEKYDFEICYSQSGDHVKQLTREAVQQNNYMVVACGGDGTLNLVASELVHTGVNMGIIPLGSGNGFARAMHIPLKVQDALQLINNGMPKNIDTGSANQVVFINVCGFGFDAHVSSKFAEAGTRGFKTYAKISLKELRAYEPKTYQLMADGNSFSQEAFVMAICNGPQYGNNAFIAPLAEFNDGWFDVTIMEQVSWKNMLGLTGNLFLRKLHLSNSVKTFRCKNLQVVQENESYVNIDGEPVWFGKQIEILLHPQSLNIMVPAYE